LILHIHNFGFNAIKTGVRTKSIQSNKKPTEMIKMIFEAFVTLAFLGIAFAIYGLEKKIQGLNNANTKKK